MVSTIRGRFEVSVVGCFLSGRPGRALEVRVDWPVAGLVGGVGGAGVWAASGKHAKSSAAIAKTDPADLFTLLIGFLSTKHLLMKS